MKYNCISAIKLAENLSSIGINYKMIASYPVQLKNLTRDKIYINIILKDENQSLDKNKMALFLADPRYYRYQRFKGIISAISDIGKDDYDFYDNWVTITDTTELKSTYISNLKKSPKIEDNEAAKYPDSKLVMRVASNEQEAIISYEQMIQSIRNFIR